MAYTNEQKGIRSIPLKSFGGMGVVGGREPSSEGSFPPTTQYLTLFSRTRARARVYTLFCEKVGLLREVKIGN